LFSLPSQRALWLDSPTTQGLGSGGAVKNAPSLDISDAKQVQKRAPVRRAFV
jgi:hypothetical protein